MANCVECGWETLNLLSFAHGAALQLVPVQSPSGSWRWNGTADARLPLQWLTTALTYVTPSVIISIHSPTTFQGDEMGIVASIYGMREADAMALSPEEVEYLMARAGQVLSRAISTDPALKEQVSAQLSFIAGGVRTGALPPAPVLILSPTPIRPIDTVPGALPGPMEPQAGG